MAEDAANRRLLLAEPLTDEEDPFQPERREVGIAGQDQQLRARRVLHTFRRNPASTAAFGACAVLAVVALINSDSSHRVDVVSGRSGASGSVDEGRFSQLFVESARDVARKLNKPLIQQAAWSAIDPEGGKGFECRRDGDDNGVAGEAKGFFEEVNATSIETCKTKCELWPGVCKGIGYDGHSRCQLWTTEIHAAVKGQARQECWKLDFPAPQSETCFELVKDDETAVHEGKEIVALKYDSTFECAFMCNYMEGCRSFTACGGLATCFLKEQTLSEAEPTKVVGHSCESFRAVPCKTPPKLHLDLEAQASSTTVPPPPAPMKLPKKAVSEELRHEEEDLFDLIANETEEIVATTTKTTSTSTATTSTATTSTSTVTRTTTTTPKYYNHWWGWQHFDYSSRSDYNKEVLDFANTSEAKAYAEKNGYSGFTWMDGRAHFKLAPRPLEKTDLDFVGSENASIFFTYSPIPAFQWKKFRGHTLKGKDAEVLFKDHGDEYFQRYAEAHGYSGYEVREPQVHMKAAQDLPLTGDDLEKEGGEDRIGAPTVWLPLMQHDKVGDSGDYYSHTLPDNSWCTAHGQDCSESKCCFSSSDFCFERVAGEASCLQSCETGDGWTCKVHGHGSMPGSELLCFTVVTLEEIPAIKKFVATNEGIAGCDEYLFFAPVSEEVAPGLWTQKIDSFGLAEDGPQKGKPDVKTVAGAWRLLMDHYLYRLHSWTIKVDIDTVFFPGSAKAILRREATNFETYDAGRGIYLKTCRDGVGGRLAHGVQALSRKAMTVFTFKGKWCSDPDDWKGAEEAWLSQCLDSIGIEGYKLGGFALDATCSADEASADGLVSSCKYDHAAIYPLKTGEVRASCARSADKPR